MNRYLFHIDYDRPGGNNPLLDGTSSSVRGDRPSMVSGDVCEVHIYFRQRAAILSAATSIALAEDAVVVLAGKKTSALTAASLLFCCDAFAKQVAGTTTYYVGTLSLNTTELATALGTANYLDVTVDVEVQNADNSARITYQFAARIQRQAYAGEGDPQPGTPVYPAPSALAVNAPAGGLHRCHNGVWQVRNVDTGKWRTWFLSGSPDQITFGPEED